MQGVAFSLIGFRKNSGKQILGSFFIIVTLILFRVDATSDVH
jgi:hypothetical protein